MHLCEQGQKKPYGSVRKHVWCCATQFENFLVSAYHLNFDFKLKNDSEQSETQFHFGNAAFVSQSWYLNKTAFAICYRIVGCQRETLYLRLLSSSLMEGH